MKKQFWVVLKLSKNGYFVDCGGDHCLAICNTLEEAKKEAEELAYYQLKEYKDNKNIDCIEFLISDVDVNEDDDDAEIVNDVLNSEIDLGEIRQLKHEIRKLEFEKDETDDKKEKEAIDNKIYALEDEIDKLENLNWL